MEEKQSARETAIQYFLQEIRSGNLKSGDKILNERQLADLLGISRVPLREAICTLSTLGILEAHQGNGTYVSEKNAQIFFKCNKKYGIFDRSIVDEVFEARILFEADAARLAAQNRTSEDLKCLQIAASAHNNFMLQIIEAIRHVTIEKDFFAEQYTVDRQHFAESQKMHREIVTAIENQNMDMAYRKMQEHIIQIRAALDLDSIRRTGK